MEKRNISYILYYNRVIYEVLWTYFFLTKNETDRNKTNLNEN